MTSTVGARLLRPGTDAAIGNLSGRVKGLERQTRGHLIYVGTYPGDPNTTPESPPFQNGWENVGGDYPPLAFLMGVDGFVRIEGTCKSGTDGTVVFTLPEGYRPDQSTRFLGSLSAGSDFWTVQIDPTGDVTVVARGFNPGVGGFDPTKISVAGATPGQVLTDVGGVAAWADPVSGVSATTEIEMSAIVIGSRGTLNFTGDGIATVSGADDVPDDRINIQVGVAPGGEGQVLTTIGGVVEWVDPSMPPTPPTVYPTIQVDGGAIGSEATINFVDANVVSIVGVHNVGTDIELDVGIVPGTDGQILTTLAGVPAWSDLIVAKTLQMEIFGTIPGAPGPTQVLRVPFVNGVSRIFDVDRLFLRVETVGSSATTVHLEKSSSPSAFVPVYIASVTVGAGDNEGETTGTLGTVQSGDLVRMNFIAIGAGAASFYAEFEAAEEV